MRYKRWHRGRLNESYKISLIVNATIPGVFRLNNDPLSDQRLSALPIQQKENVVQSGG